MTPDHLLCDKWCICFRYFRWAVAATAVAYKAIVWLLVAAIVAQLPKKTQPNVSKGDGNLCRFKIK